MAAGGSESTGLRFDSSGAVQTRFHRVAGLGERRLSRVLPQLTITFVNHQEFGEMTYETHPNLEDITDGDAVLWRYVDLYKWLDMLQTSELHLTRVDQMEDRWEGAYSTVNVAMRPSMYGKDWPMMAASIPKMYEFARTHVYLNCWYMGEEESAGMWKLYDTVGKGVAIRTTAGRLKESLVGSHKPPISGAKVQYVDYSKTLIPEGNVFFPCVHKRSSFSHEREYRLLAMWTPGALERDADGKAIRLEPDVPPALFREAIDLGRLVEAVYVSPDAPSWVARVVDEVTGKYMPGLSVRHSDLAADPVY